MTTVAEVISDIEKAVEDKCNDGMVYDLICLLDDAICSDPKAVGYKDWVVIVPLFLRHSIRLRKELLFLIEHAMKRRENSIWQLYKVGLADRLIDLLNDKYVHLDRRDGIIVTEKAAWTLYYMFKHLQRQDCSEFDAYKYCDKIYALCDFEQSTHLSAPSEKGREEISKILPKISTSDDLHPIRLELMPESQMIAFYSSYFASFSSNPDIEKLYKSKKAYTVRFVDHTLLLDALEEKNLATCSIDGWYDLHLERFDRSLRKKKSAALSGFDGCPDAPTGKTNDIIETSAITMTHIVDALHFFAKITSDAEGLVKKAEAVLVDLSEADKCEVTPPVGSFVVCPCNVNGKQVHRRGQVLCNENDGVTVFLVDYGTITTVLYNKLYYYTPELNRDCIKPQAVLCKIYGATHPMKSKYIMHNLLLSGKNLINLMKKDNTKIMKLFMYYAQYGDACINSTALKSIGHYCRGNGIIQTMFTDLHCIEHVIYVCKKFMECFTDEGSLERICDAFYAIKMICWDYSVGQDSFKCNDGGEFCKMMLTSLPNCAATDETIRSVMSCLRSTRMLDLLDWYRDNKPERTYDIELVEGNKRRHRGLIETSGYWTYSTETDDTDAEEEGEMDVYINRNEQFLRELQEKSFDYNELLHLSNTQNTQIMRFHALNDISATYLETHICAFLNSCTQANLFLGINDIGHVTGVYAPRSGRDSFRQGVSSVMCRLSPRVLPQQFNVFFHPLKDRKTGVPMPNQYLIQILLLCPSVRKTIYCTRNEDYFMRRNTAVVKCGPKDIYKQSVFADEAIIASVIEELEARVQKSTSSLKTKKLLEGDVTREEQLHGTVGEDQQNAIKEK